MKKLLSVTLALLPLLAAGQDLPRYDEPQQSAQDPDVWLVTKPHTGQRFIEVAYTPMPEVIAANARQADQQQLPAAARREKLHHDSTDYSGGLVFISATCPGRTTIDGALTVVVLDDQQHELLRRTLACTEAELSISATDFARIYAVALTRPLPPNAIVRVEDMPAQQRHEFMIRPVSK